MTWKFDHAVIAVNDLDQAVTDYRALGFTTIYGGEHAAGTTHNALICFQDGSYFELLAPTGKPARPGVNASNFSNLLEQGEGLIGYALISENLAENVAAMRKRGVDISDAKPGGRLRMDGVELRWQSALAGTSMSPFFIEDITSRHLRVPNDDATVHHSNGVTGVRELAFVVANLDTAAQLYQDMLGIEGDRSDVKISFTLGSTHLKLIKATEDYEHQYVARWGDAPYSVTLVSSQPISLNPSRTHGVDFETTEITE